MTEGGSSQIFLLRASLVYVNSTDGQCYNFNAVQKNLVVKRLKPEYRQKLKSKIIHEKSIIMLLKSGCSRYLPCYYMIESHRPFSNDILMDALTG